jgi:cysteine desulfurase/selenocysteine lyase
MSQWASTTSMAIPTLDPNPPLSPDATVGGDPFDTALIARLANEFFSGSHHSAPASLDDPEVPPAVPAILTDIPTAPTAMAGVPVALPGTPAVMHGIPSIPSVPAGVQGIPSSLPTMPTTLGGAAAALPGIPSAPGIPGFASGTDGEHGLAGGFPLASPTAHPPVHPILESADAEDAGIEEPAAGTPSGAHDPKSPDVHAFGEPRCNGTVFGDSAVKTTSHGGNPASPAAGKPTGLPSADAGASIPGIELASTPEFYFLRSYDAVERPVYPDKSRPIASPTLSVFDVQAIRRDFPALHQKVNGKQLIWLDNAATTHKPQSVIDATSSFYSKDNSNIHRAAHTLAARSTELFEGGREKVRQFLGAADAKEIVFVRGTTEAINLVAQSYGRSKIGAGDEIVLTTMEHHANIVPWQLLAEQVGAALRVAPINDRGELILEEFVKLLGPRTKFVSITHVSNALGTINPVEQVIALAHAKGIPVLVDGAQSTPHIPVNVQALDADFFVFSAHKIFGPTGIGALYGKSHLLEKMPPWQGGGHMIKDVTFARTTYNRAPEKFEAGTPDIAGVVGLGAAIDYLFKVGIPAIAAYEHTLLEYATHALSAVPGLRPIGTALNKASVLSFVIPGISNERIGRHLDKNGIAVRAGHHCAQPALRHFGVETAVRPSLAFYNTFEEVDALIQALHGLLNNDR